MYFYSLWAVMDYEVVWEDLFGKSNANFELEMQYRYYELHHSMLQCNIDIVYLLSKQEAKRFRIILKPVLIQP